MLEIVIRPRAKNDLRNIVRYTTEQWDKEKAKIYLETILSKIRSASKFPSLGPSIFGSSEAYRKLVSGSHLVIYRAYQTHLIVVRVLHERMDVQTKLM